MLREGLARCLKVVPAQLENNAPAELAEALENLFGKAEGAANLAFTITTCHVLRIVLF